MKQIKTILFVLSLFLGAQFWAQEIIILEGQYQKRNVFVANSSNSMGIGFCSFEVRVNGALITDEINVRAYEIDLSIFELKLEDPVIIEIKHKKGCVPKVLNPEALQAKPTFNSNDITVSDEGVLSWETTDEHGSLPFVVQQYKWNKWVDVGEVQGSGEPTLNKYTYQVDFVYGENKFRVVQKINQQRIRKTKTVVIDSEKPKLNFVYNRKNKKVVFSNTTAYEIHDKYGQLIMRGFNSQADVSHLIRDEYYVSFDNVTKVLAKR
jgi:hypothetical protein